MDKDLAPEKAYTEEQVRSRLTDWITAHGYVKAVQHFGVTESYLRKVCRPADHEDARPPSQKILAGLGLRKCYVDAG